MLISGFYIVPYDHPPPPNTFEVHFFPASKDAAAGWRVYNPKRCYFKSIYPVFDAILPVFLFFYSLFPLFLTTFGALRIEVVQVQAYAHCTLAAFYNYSISLIFIFHFIPQR